MTYDEAKTVLQNRLHVIREVQYRAADKNVRERYAEEAEALNIAIRAILEVQCKTEP